MYIYLWRVRIRARVARAGDFGGVQILPNKALTRAFSGRCRRRWWWRRPAVKDGGRGGRTPIPPLCAERRTSWLVTQMVPWLFDARRRGGLEGSATGRAAMRPERRSLSSTHKLGDRALPSCKGLRPPAAHQGPIWAVGMRPCCTQ
jgi:hypothetical protein